MSSSWTSDLLNDTSTDASVTEVSSTTVSHSTIEWTLIAVKLTIGIFGTIGNLFVCAFVGQMKFQVKFLIRSQSTIDLLASILIVADTITAEIQVEPPPPHKHPVLGQLYCTLYTYQLLLFGLFAASSYNLVAIAIERYITVFHPFWYRINFSQTKTFLLGLLAWVWGPVAQTIYSCYSGRYIDGQCKWQSQSATRRRNLAIMLFLWDFGFPCILMAFCFMRISFKLREYDSNKVLQHKYAGRASSAPSTVSQTVTTVALDPISGGSVSTTQNYKAEADKEKEKSKEAASERSRSQKVSRMFILVFLAYVCCWSTNQILFLQYNCGGYRHFGTPEYHFANSMAILNCAINPFIYVLHLKQYRKEVKSFFSS